jgi:IMP dehydrogenase
MLEIKEGLTFDDLLLVPQYSEVESRSKIDLTVKMGDLSFKHPIIPANMQTVTGRDMAYAILNSGGLAILHRFMSIQEQIDIAEDVMEGFVYGRRFAVSIGVQPHDLDNFARFYELGIRIVCVDIAHGDSKHCVETVQTLRKQYPKLFIIAGNVATGSGAKRLWEAGADAVKTNVGGGSLCTTRIETGNGVPTLTTLIDVANVRKELTRPTNEKLVNIGVDSRGEYTANLVGDPPIINRPLYIISDGGCKNAGDLVKSLCFADMVMSGNLFAGCEEAPGATHRINGVPHKEYKGSSTHKANHIEGVAAWVPCTGKYEDVLTKLLEGIRSGCSYQGAHNLTELKDSPAFIKITPAGLKESHPHDVVIE